MRLSLSCGEGGGEGRDCRLQMRYMCTSSNGCCTGTAGPLSSLLASEESVSVSVAEESNKADYDLQAHS